MVLFENEGNARMVTTVPKTQITLMGMERIIPSWADLEVMATFAAFGDRSEADGIYVRYQWSEENWMPMDRTRCILSSLITAVLFSSGPRISGA